MFLRGLNKHAWSKRNGELCSAASASQGVKVAVQKHERIEEIRTKRMLTEFLLALQTATAAVRSSNTLPGDIERNLLSVITKHVAPLNAQRVTSTLPLL